MKYYQGMFNENVNSKPVKKLTQFRKKPPKMVRSSKIWKTWRMQRVT